MLRERKHTVLLIEADRSMRRLITLGLEYLGMYVIEAGFPTSIPALQSQLPDIVVLDIDSEAGSDYTLLSTFQSHPYFSSVPLIVLSWDCLVTSGSHLNGSHTSIACLVKPFDARTLHTTIEQIHDTRNFGPSSRQELLLANRSVTPTPSIWPLITAAGLVLALIGLMTQIAISALGLLVILIALLWWTLGTKAKSGSLAV
jgi:DNA-binding response OmpR family regulator